MTVKDSDKLVEWLFFSKKEQRLFIQVEIINNNMYFVLIINCSCINVKRLKPLKPLEPVFIVNCSRLPVIHF